MKKINLFLAVIFFLLCQTNVYGSTIKFAQISDLHYQSNVLRKNVNYYALPIIDSAAEQINNDEDIKFTLITGDIINKRKYNDAEFIYKHFNEIFKSPWYSVFGNHDLGGRIVFKIKLIHLLKEINNLFKNIKKDYYSFKPKSDLLFIGLNSNYTFKRTPIGHISKGQLLFLKEKIDEANKNDVIVIFMHHTPIDFPEVHKNHYIQNKQDFLEILKKSQRTILLLGGHYHACKIERGNNIIKVATPSLTSFPLAFRVIEIDNSATKTVFNFEYKDVDEQLQEHIFKYLNIKKVETRAGREYDKNISITIERDNK